MNSVAWSQQWDPARVTTAVSTPRISQIRVKVDGHKLTKGHNGTQLRRVEKEQAGHNHLAFREGIIQRYLHSARLTRIYADEKGQLATHEVDWYRTKSCVFFTLTASVRRRVIQFGSAGGHPS
jgi:hypothetical protein